jgi:polysaccharide export outer membrane protein
MNKLLRIILLFLLLSLLLPHLALLGLTASSHQVDPGRYSITLCWAQESNTKAELGNLRSSTPAPSRDYLIGKGDVLEVFVWRNQQISRRVLVRPDGKISLPLLQDIQADGLTVLQLKSEITRRFSEHIENPRVTVIVVEMGSYKVSVLGRVERPGVYPITGQTTVVEAIALAGGFTEWASKGSITVVTHQNGKEKKVRVNYKKIASGKDPSQNIVLTRGDIIIVP